MVEIEPLRTILGAMKSSLINAMQVECVAPLLTLSDKYLFRYMQFQNHSPLLRLQRISTDASTSTYCTHKSFPCLIVSYRKYLSLQTTIYNILYFPIFSATYEALTLSQNFSGF